MFADADCERPFGQFFLMGTVAPGWQLSQPLLLFLEQDDDGSHLISDDLFGVYGEGDTQVEALEDYIVSLTDYYELLAARVTEEPPFTQAMFDRLQRYVCKLVGA